MIKAVSIFDQLAAWTDQSRDREFPTPLHRNLSKIGSFHSRRRLYNLKPVINCADIPFAKAAPRGAVLRGLLILIRL
jgi:hypothetical protein